MKQVRDGIHSNEKNEEKKMTENGGAEEGSEDGCHHRSKMRAYDYKFLQSNHSRKIKNWERFSGGYSNLPGKTTHQNPTAGREQHPKHDRERREATARLLERSSTSKT